MGGLERGRGIEQEGQRERGRREGKREKESRQGATWRWEGARGERDEKERRQG